MKKYDLTFPQKNIWMVENFYEAQEINIISGSFVIKKDFDIGLAEQMVNKFVELNEGMRLRIEVENNIPKQYVVPFMHFEADKVDIQDMSEDEIEELKDNYISKPIDMTDGPLFSYLLLNRGNGLGEVFVKVHHIIGDAWTIAKMGSAFSEIYEKLLNDEEYTETFPSYIDFIEAEQEYLNSEKYIKDNEFWKEYLAASESPLGLKDSGKLKDTKAKRRTIVLDEKYQLMLDEYCKENRVSPYTVFLSALAIYTERVTEKTDFIIGTPVLNRSNFKEKNMSGMFISTMPVRFKIDESETFLELVKRMGTESLTLFRHQKYPYLKISEAYKNETSLSDNMYKLMLSYQNARANVAVEGKYELRWRFSGHIQDELEIHISDLNDTGRLEVHFDYLTSLFEPIEIEYLTNRILALIEDGIRNNSKIETIKIMSDEERNKILNEFNDTARPYPKDKTIIELFEEQVRLNPKSIAIIFNNKEYTYDEINKLANNLAYTLKDEIKKDDIIGIKLERSEKVLISILAVLKLGAAYIPIDINYPKERIKYMLEDAKVSKIITDKDFECFCELGQTILNVKVDENAAFYVLYTSGSTGNPKGAIISHKNMLNFYAHFKEIKEFDNVNKVISITTVSFDIFVFEAILPLLFGKTVVMTNEEEQKNPLKIREVINKQKVDMIQSTPSRMKLILDSIGGMGSISSITKVVLAGEQLPEDLRDRIKDAGVQVCNGYGPTETTIFSSYTDVTNSNAVTIGKPLNNTKFLVRDSKYRLLPLGVTGELYIAGDGVTLGYIHKKELTKKSFLNIDGTLEYKSGDYVRIGFDLNTICEGRKDSQVKIHGLRIELDEISLKLRQISQIKDAVTAVYENNNDKRIVAFVSSDSKKLEENIIKQELYNVLPSYMVPQNIVILDKLIYTANGKVNKKELMEKHLNNVINRGSSDNILISKTEKEIIQIIAETCEKNISINESFTREGLDSFDMIRLAVSLSNKYNKDILVRDIINLDNVKDLALEIEVKPLKQRINSNVETKSKISKNQASILYAYIKDANSVLYNTPSVINVGSDIDVNKLKDVLIAVLNYHEAFRSNIKIEAGESYLEYNENKQINVEVVNTDINGYERIKKNYVKPFDLLNDTLVRTQIVKTEESCYVLFDSHHIIFDGSSIECIINEIKEVFNGTLTLKGTDNYIMHLNSITAKDNKEDVEFYIQKISGAEPTEIETDFKLDKLNNHHGNRISAKLDNNAYKKLQDYAVKNFVNINSICLAALQLVLSKYTYNENIMIGIATTNRDSVNTNMVGMFVNTLPFVSSIDTKDTSSNFIAKTNNIVKDIVSHNSCTVDEIIQESKLNLKDLFKIVYAYQNFKWDEITLGNSKAKLEYMYRDVSKFDLTFELTPKENGIDIVIEYNNNLYSFVKIDKLLMHYINCINEIIEKDKLNQIDILTIDEKNKILALNNIEKKVISDSIQKIFKSVVKDNTNKTAIVHNGESITYEELDKYSNILANKLIKFGVNKGDIVPIMMNKSIELIVGIMAIIKAGAAYLPLDINIPNERLTYMIKNVSANTVITKKGLLDTSILRLINNNIYVDLSEIKSEEDKKVLVKGDVNDVCYVMYTSGSTGLPKGVVIRQEGVIRLVKDTNYIVPLPSDNVALSGTISFDASVFEMWLSIINGLTLHIIDKELLLNQEEFESYIKQNKITIMLLTTALFNSFAAYKPDMFNEVRYLLTGGDVFSYKSGNNVIKINRDIKLINAYGPTESTVIATTYRYDKELIGEVPIGTPITNTSCYVVDIFAKPVPYGAIGELYIGGIAVTSGYINNSLETDKHLVYTDLERDKLYKTGDLVKLNENNLLVFKRRKDNQIKLNGYRIEINEVLNVLLGTTGVKEAEILFSKDNNNDMVAYVVLEDDITKQDILEALKSKLPYYMVPKAIVVLDSMPLTVQGKVDRRKLQELKYDITTNKVAATTDEEKTLVEIWENLLNRNDIGIQDNFFELGGDSILATQFVMEASNRNLGFVYSDIYNYPTIKELLEKSEDKLSKQYDMTSFDYDKLNNNIKEYDIRKRREIKNVLITGATGFLGAHVLSNFIDNYDGKAYCIIRKRGKDSKDRLKDILNYFFGDKYDKYIDDRIVVITGDLTVDKFGLTIEEYDKLSKNIDAVINCAAYVKHFGNLDKFKKINVDTVSNLINLCIKEDKELYHVSTLSVCGNILEGGQVAQTIDYDKVFDETDLYFGQKLNNAYVYSKYLAEVNIIDKLSEGLKATIIRVGNLTGRYSDGKFQPNVEENAFANRIKAFAYMKAIPESLMRFNVEFTPIDYTAEAICKMIFSNKDRMLITHVYNNNYVNMKSVIQALNDNDILIDILEDASFSNKLKEYMFAKDSHVDGIVIDLNKDSKVTYESNISVNADNTNNYLETLGYKWPNISDEYLMRYFKHLIDIGFLINGEER